MHLEGRQEGYMEGIGEQKGNKGDTKILIKIKDIYP